MDLKLYFESYRNSVLADAPKGFVEYAKTCPTRSPDFPTIFSYLQLVTDWLNTSIKQGHQESFDHNIRAHRIAMLELFKKIVYERGPFSEGWKSYKFSSEAIAFDNGVSIIPRHGIKPVTSTWIYATEMFWVKDTRTAAELVKFKKTNNNKFVKLVDGKMVSYGDLMNHEGIDVVEWTADL